MPNLTLVNTYYPIDYLATANIDQFVPSQPEQFWASQEMLAPSYEDLVYEFGQIRSVNFIDFEISQKPVDIEISYLDPTDDIWKVVETVDWFEPNLSLSYVASDANPWHYFEYYFTKIDTARVRVKMTRREERFPFPDSPEFPWSIEVRNLRLMYIITLSEEFVPSSGSDILGNTYVTDMIEHTSANVIDGDPTTYWQSQPNPSRLAVEALYFDVRGSWNTVTMDYLDNLNDDADPNPDPNGMTQAQMNTKSVSELELYYEAQVVVDGVFIDPITTGPYMHIYYSSDDAIDWDNKLWSPVPQHYQLRRGYHSFPHPVKTKYLKVEFSNLTPAPYNMAEYPKLPPIRYRRFPTWVQNLFLGGGFSKPIFESSIESPDFVSIDPLRFGFVREPDKLSTVVPASPLFVDELNDPEVKDFVSQIITVADQTEQTKTESKIDFRAPHMWQSDLLSFLPTDRALSRLIIEGETDFNTETAVPFFPAPDIQSIPNLEKAKEEKQFPMMWFPQRCRHGYQIVDASRPSKVAYFAAIRTITFHRQDYTIPHDEEFYVETLQDVAHTQRNDFVQDDWRFIITP